MDTSIEELKNQAVYLGLAGEDIAKYVLNQQAIFRDERAKEREAEKLRVASEAEKLRVASETEKLRVATEIEKLKLANEAEKERQAHELELAKINASNNSISPEGPIKPTLPVLKDGEDIATYLIRFERVASLLNLKRDTYAVRLGSLLTGKAVEIYTSLSPSITSNYDDLKKALLIGFSKTAQGYRQDFRNAKIRCGETYNQFSIHLGRLFDLWIDNIPVNHTYEDLRSFMINDQLISSFSPDLRMYIKEHNVMILNETIRLADNWVTAHNAYPKTSRPDQGKVTNYKSFTPLSDAKTKIATTGFHDRTAVGSHQFKGQCNGCGNYGPIKSRCPKNPLAFKNTNPSENQIGYCWDEKKSQQLCNFWYC